MMKSSNNLEMFRRKVGAKLHNRWAQAEALR